MAASWDRLTQLPKFVLLQHQVCILGLPWEYTAKDVRALLEGAGHVDKVQVLYRPDGKSEVGGQGSD